ncbi:hypothetical protein Hs30E_14020 [Lactococcus hodotermopsidis]|uniref:YolD-like protein n=1 Tax=Pseudolactococcus hodotermopsidis TaxID=2709157 RepID=A0A6A0BF05_9LACT|nr:hypothetical protein [Lactococcus hodotermopsidis]GFH42851.1 hypothetical protein Hs30E_14020 [Lactococcus hodotermopsidis]
MKKLFQKIMHFLSGDVSKNKQDSDEINLEMLANLELAHSFNHAIFLHFKEKNGETSSFTGIISSITERQVVVKDLKSNQIRIILLSKIKKVTFVPETVKNALLENESDQKNA